MTNSVSKMDFYQALHVVTGGTPESFKNSLKKYGAVSGLLNYPSHIKPYKNIDLSNEKAFQRRFPNANPALAQSLILLEKMMGNGDGHFNSIDRKLRKLTGKKCVPHFDIVMMELGRLSSTITSVNINVKRSELTPSIEALSIFSFFYFYTGKGTPSISRANIQNDLDNLIATFQERCQCRCRCR